MKNTLLVAIAILTGMAVLSQSTAKADKTPYLLIGTYTNNGSEGIYVYKFNTDSGTAAPVSLVKTDNPSYLAVSPNEKYVYAVNENGGKGNPGAIAAFSFNKGSGELSWLNKQPSGGDHPCYVAIDRSGKWVTSGNYSGGSVAVLPVKEDGSLSEAVCIKQHEGQGADPKRQEKPHVHSTVFSPDAKQLLVADLGTDKVHLYDFNNKDGQLTPSSQPFFKVKDGDGPRHLAFHPNGKFVYLMEEMGGNVLGFRYANGTLKELQTISSHPADFTTLRGSADIHISPDGRFLYASNRSSANSIAIFSVNPQTGLLKIVGITSVSGKNPRNFSLDPAGNFLLVANQDTNDVVIFKRNKTTGLLTDTGNRIQVKKPVCLKWIHSK